MDVLGSTCPPRYPSAAAQTPLPQRQPGPVRVMLRAWGATEEDVDRAIAAARQPLFHRTWEITSVERLVGVPCPFPDYDPKMITKESGYGWSYMAFPDRSAA